MLSEDLYTGLKDKNEKEIYEGDIVKSKATRYDYNSGYSYVTDEFIGVVNFKYFGFFIMRFNNLPKWREQRFELTQIDEVEVIGNKFENPELLKEVKE